MSPEAPEAAVTSRQWLCAGSDTKGPSCHLVLPTTQDQQSLAVVAGGVLLQEEKPCQRTWPGEAWFKVLGTGKSTAPCPGHPAGIPAAVEDASQTSQHWGQVPPPQVMLSHCSGPHRTQGQGSARQGDEPGRDVPALSPQSCGAAICQTGL